MSRYFCLRGRVVVPALLFLFTHNALAQAPPVQDLQCVCEQDAPAGGFQVRLTWVNPIDPLVNPFDLEITRDDGQSPILVPGEPGPTQEYTDTDPLLGLHGYTVVLVVQGMRSDLVLCTAECPPPPGLPVARIQGPNRLVLPPLVPGDPKDFIEVILDGRRSTDGIGGAALRYEWSPGAGDADVEILSPFAAVTRVRIMPSLVPPTFVSIQLKVERARDFNAQNQDTFPIQLVEPGVFPDEPPQLFRFPDPPDFLPAPRDLLVAVAGQRCTLPLMFDQGVPYPNPQVLPAPPTPDGPRVEEGQLVWIPQLHDAGRDHLIQLLLDNGVGAAVTEELQIRVVHPGSPLLMYGFPSPDAGNAGGGGTLGPAPATIPDQGSAQPDLSLQLSPLAIGAECTAQLITAGGGDPVDGVLFDPGCVPLSSGLYFTAAPAGGILPAGSNDFSVEVWVSGVQAPPAGRGYVFSNSQGTSDINWLIAHDGGENFAAVVEVGGVEQTLAVTASPRPDGLTHLVFVRRGDTHQFFVNGAFVSDLLVPPADLVAGWDANYAVTFGNSRDEARPFDGNVHLAAFYDTALSVNLISYLDEIGPGIPSSVPPPVADICPDPGEIRRVVQADGSQSYSSLGAGAGAGAASSGTGDGCPDMLLPPFLWELFPSDVAAAPTAEAVPDPDACALETEITYVVPPGGRFDLTIRLTVTQFPVRGAVETGTAEKTIRLPTYFWRGDGNGDNAADLSDAVAVLNMLFVSGTPLPCMDACDANDDGGVDLSDPIYWLAYLFSGGPPPPPPFPGCDADWTDDSELEPINGDLRCIDPPDYCG
jgi:hypothetical protein